MLEQLNIYPIKSCSGIQLQQAETENRGFPMDRRWMLVEADGKFISQRKTPQLGQFNILISDNSLTVSYPGESPLSIGLNSHLQQQVEIQIWNDTLHCHHVAHHASKWFSQILHREVYLVAMDPSVKRPLIKKHLPQDQNFEVSFADGYPYLLTNHASLDDLNSRLENPIGMDRFRANIEVSGFEAFSEEDWKRIKIGTVDFLVVKPCARCQVTTIDQQTGTASKEPLKTLATYRRQNGQVMFGVNMLALNRGTVRLNDTIKILE